MPARINGRPGDGIRKLNLRYRVDDPRYASVERLRERLGHGQVTGVLLASLVIGADAMLERVTGEQVGALDRRAQIPPMLDAAVPDSGAAATPARATPTPTPTSFGEAHAHESDLMRPMVPAPRMQPPAPAPSGQERFSEGARRQFEQFGEDD